MTTTPREPLEYERMRARPSRHVTPAAIAVALGGISCVWALVSWVLPTPPFPDAARWMLISGILPSATVGLLIGAIAARGPWRLPSCLLNLAALGSAVGLSVVMIRS